MGLVKLKLLGAGRWRRSGAIAFAAVLLATGLWGLAYAGDPAPAGANFSLQAESVPLGQVVKEVAAATGYRIELPSEWAQELITANVDRAPLLVGLAEVLSAYNHYFITDDDAKTLTIGILGRCGGVSQPPAGNRPGRRRLSVTPSPGAAGGATSVLNPPPPRIRVPAPTGGGGNVVVVGAASEPVPVNADQIEVVPPSADGTPAPTLEEVEAETKQTPPVDPTSVELVPPGHE